MHDVSTIESINREQLATASDRLLLRGRVWHRAQTPSAAPSARGGSAAPPARGSSPAIPCARLAEGSQTQIPVARLAEGSQPQIVIPAQHTPHSPRTPHALRPTPHSLRLTPHTPHTPHSLRHTPHALHPLPPVRASQTLIVRQPTSSVRRVGRIAATAAVIAIPTLVGFAIGFAAVR